MIERLRERVQRGAAFLNEREPEWFRRIDVDRLDMRFTFYVPGAAGSVGCGCIGAQLSGSYGDFLTEHIDALVRAGGGTVSMGFTLSGDGYRAGFHTEELDAWETLTRLWKEEIAASLEAANA